MLPTHILMMMLLMMLIIMMMVEMIDIVNGNDDDDAFVRGESSSSVHSLPLSYCMHPSIHFLNWS